jgi:hypothetical protein
MSQRLALFARCHHVTQKVKIAGQLTRYISVHDDEYPTGIFLRQNVGPLSKSPGEDLPQDTQREQSAAKWEDS